MFINEIINNLKPNTLLISCIVSILGILITLVIASLPVKSSKEFGIRFALKSAERIVEIFFIAFFGSTTLLTAYYYEEYLRTGKMPVTISAVSAEFDEYRANSEKKTETYSSQLDSQQSTINNQQSTIDALKDQLESINKSIANLPNNAQNILPAVEVNQTRYCPDNNYTDWDQFNIDNKPAIFSCQNRHLYAFSCNSGVVNFVSDGNNEIYNIRFNQYGRSNPALDEKLLPIIKDGLRYSYLDDQAYTFFMDADEAVIRDVSGRNVRNTVSLKGVKKAANTYLENCPVPNHQ